LLSTHSVKTNKDKVFIVGICHQVHHCVNAFLPKHKCTFAVCADCKNEFEDRQQDQQGTTKRTRSSLQNSSNKTRNASDLKKALNKKYQNKIGEKKQIPNGECDEEHDHDYRNLKATCDVSFFDNAFLKQVEKTNRPFPTKCNRCNAKFRKN
jgi:hypothetical protein